MKLSVETKVAAGIGASFVVLTLGLVAQESSGDEAGRFSHHGFTKSHELSNIIRPEPKIPFSWRQEPSTSFTDDAGPTTIDTGRTKEPRTLNSKQPLAELAELDHSEDD